MSRSRFLLMLSVLPWFAGCTPVSPWERGSLAKTQMAAEPYPAQRALRSHTYGSREAASGGDTSAAGGGCGCY